MRIIKYKLEIIADILPFNPDPEALDKIVTEIVHFQNMFEETITNEIEQERIHREEEQRNN